MIKGVLLDVDGTLVLSNDAHAHAWVEAYAELGYQVSFQQVRRLIGMGSDKLIEALTPKLNDEEGDGKAIKDKRSEIFLEKYADVLEPAPGSRELVEAILYFNLKAIVASSAKSEELHKLLKAARVDDLLNESVTSDEVNNSKPDPDIVETALQKIGLPPEEVVMIGDTPYDIEAAKKANVTCIAVRAGGWSDKELAGALSVYDSPADIVAHREDFEF